MVKMDPPKLVPPGTNLLINTDPLELILLQNLDPPLKNLDHPMELILLINKDPGTYFTATFGPPPPTTIWTTPLELILLINKDHDDSEWRIQLSRLPHYSSF